MRVMAIVADSLDEPADLSRTRERITYAAREALQGADSASFTVRDVKTGIVETAAATDDILYEVDRLQYELKEGPCFDAVTVDEIAISADIGTDPRWPHFGPRAAALGVGSQLGIRLRDGDVVEGLNLYARASDTFREPLDDVRMVAAQARSILGYARTNQTLTQGLASRTVIGAAVGIVMERYQLEESQAFQFLVRVSQTSNLKLRDVAESLVHPSQPQAKSAE